jgi:hypothetical protein
VLSVLAYSDSGETEFGTLVTGTERRMAGWASRAKLSGIEVGTSEAKGVEGERWRCDQRLVDDACESEALEISPPQVFLEGHGSGNDSDAKQSARKVR